jgi:transcriptional regulator GlxA family with amidase domain
MEIALLLYDGMAALDAVGPYEVLRNVPGWEVRTVAPAKGEVRDERGTMGLVADRALAEVASADVLLVPGGRGNRPLLQDDGLLEWLREIDRTTMLLEHEPLHAWIRGVHETSKWTTSVCTGSLLLGAAGLLEGKRATTNWLELDTLRAYGADPVGGRFVEDGKVITAAGVTAGIDMALHLVAREVGPEVAQAIQLGIEYDPHPPFDSGSPEKAPAEIVELVRSVTSGG